MLTALDGSVYRLGSGIDKGDEARTRDSLKDMRQLVARLRKMVLDILYFAKERKLDWNILVAEEFMRSVVSTVSDKAAEAGIAMTLEADGDPAPSRPTPPPSAPRWSTCLRTPWTPAAPTAPRRSTAYG